MATATLLVRISAQMAEFKSAFDESQKTLKDFGNAFEGIGVKAGLVGGLIGGAVSAGLELFGNAVRGAIGFVKDLGDSLVGMVTTAAQLGEEMFHLSQRTGIGVESLGQLQYVAAQSGISMETLTRSVQMMTERIGKGTKETSAAVQKLGLSMAELKKQDPGEAFTTLLSKLGQVPNAAERAALGAAIFGRSFRQISALASESVDETIAEFKKLGLGMTAEGAAAGKAFSDAMTTVRAQISKVTLELGGAFLPALTAFTRSFSDAWHQARRASGVEMAAIGESVDKLAVWVGENLGRMIAAIADVIAAFAQFAQTGFQFGARNLSWIAETTAKIYDMGAAMTRVMGIIGNNTLAAEESRKGFERLASTTRAAANAVSAVGDFGSQAADKLRVMARTVADAGREGAANFGAHYTKVLQDIAKKADQVRQSSSEAGGLIDPDPGGKTSGAMAALKKNLAALTGELKEAQKAGVPMANQMELFGKRAAEASKLARAWGVQTSGAVDDIARSFRQQQLVAEFEKTDRAVEKIFDRVRREVSARRFQTLFGGASQHVLSLREEMRKTGIIADNLFDVSFRRRHDNNLRQLAEDTPAVVAGLEEIARKAQRLPLAFKDSLNEIPTIIKAALTGGGGVGNAIIAMASDLGGRLGRILGEKISESMETVLAKGSWLKNITSLLPGIFGAIGSLIPSLFGKLFGPTEYEKAMKAAREETKQLHTEILKTHGGMDRLAVIADTVGINIREAFKWQDPAAFKKVLEDLESKTNKLNAAMAEYGFTWEDLGDKARQQKLTDIALELLEKTNLLKQAGIDYSEILRRQANDYSNLVQAAFRTGTEIPRALQPVLQELADMGLLIDESGNALTDLSRITWAETLRESTDRIVDKLDELIDKLVNGVGGALDNLGRRAVRVPVSIEVDTSGLDEFNIRVPALQHGGIVRRPTLALIGEAGPEAVIPLSRDTAAASGAQATSDVGITFKRGAFEGMIVDSPERVDQMAEAIFKRVRRDGAMRTTARKALGVG